MYQTNQSQNQNNKLQNDEQSQDVDDNIIVSNDTKPQERKGHDIGEVEADSDKKNETLGNMSQTQQFNERNFGKSDLRETTSKILGSISRINEDYKSSYPAMFYNYGPGYDLDKEMAKVNLEDNKTELKKEKDQEIRLTSNVNYNSNPQSSACSYYDYKKSNLEEQLYKSNEFTSNTNKFKDSSNTLNQSYTYENIGRSYIRQERVVSPTRSNRFCDSSINEVPKSNFDYLYEKYLSPRRYLYAEPTLYSPTYCRKIESPRYRPYRSPIVYRPYVSYISPRRLYVSPYRVTSPLKYRSPFRDTAVLSNSEKFNLNKTANSTNLAYFLSDIINNEIATEKIKEELCLKVDASLEDIFSLFDIRRVGHISILDFKDTLLDLNLYPNMDDIKLLYKRFDKDMDGKLR